MRRAEREIREIKALSGILDRAKFATLAFLNGGAPALIPLSFGYRIEAGERFVFYFHTALEGRKTECLKADARASLSVVGESRIELAEPVCRSTCRYESVIAEGRVEFVADPDEKRHALDLIMRQCGGSGTGDYPRPMLDRTAILCFAAVSISGKSNLPGAVGN